MNCVSGASGSVWLLRVYSARAWPSALDQLISSGKGEQKTSGTVPRHTHDFGTRCKDSGVQMDAAMEFIRSCTAFQGYQMSYQATA